MARRARPVERATGIVQRRGCSSRRTKRSPAPSAPALACSLALQRLHYFQQAGALLGQPAGDPHTRWKSERRAIANNNAVRQERATKRGTVADIDQHEVRN